ncbi:MAG TPA: A24 family peptidase C-terminal domain-containing protein [Thermoplasmata archaeon]|nr:A24 family peptidase C-terminal domain-containing protein [Thermoplasmata archaeon]
MTPSVPEAVGLAILLAGFAYAALTDWRVREVSDRLWLVMSLFGAAWGIYVEAPGSALGLALWLLASAFVIEHLVPWDARLEKSHPRLPSLVEAGTYLAVALIAGIVAWKFGIGPAGLPTPVLAVLLSVYLARGLFEFGVLYGGADAKALIAAGILVPFLAHPFLGQPGNAGMLLGVTPFAVVVLIDAALLSLAVPVAIAVRNVRDGNFRVPGGFTGYVIPVEELPHRFVWLKDPFLHGEEEAVDTTQEDIALRRRQAEQLRARGATEVWVTPQIPYLLLLFAGSVAAVLVGNLLFDLLALL